MKYTSEITQYYIYIPQILELSTLVNIFFLLVKENMLNNLIFDALNVSVSIKIYYLNLKVVVNISQ